MQVVENKRYSMQPLVDAKGKKFAEISADRKRIKIAKQGRFIEFDFYQYKIEIISTFLYNIRKQEL